MLWKVKFGAHASRNEELRAQLAAEKRRKEEDEKKNIEEQLELYDSLDREKRMASRAKELQMATEKEKRALEEHLNDTKLPDVLKRTQISSADIVLEKLLGSGTFGEVHQGVWHGTPVAVKRLHRSKLHGQYLQMFIDGIQRL